MQQVGASPKRRIDPAPSRLSYRFERLLLTPGVRSLIRTGVPILLILTILSSWYSQADNRVLLNRWIENAITAFQERPQFMVTSMNMTGGDLATLTQVAQMLPTQYPVSSFRIDLVATRMAIEELEPVKSASVRIGPDATLEVRITPRVPVAIWRDDRTLRLIDAEGVLSGTIAVRADRLDLPLIAGAGAEGKINEALMLFAATGPLLPRVRGLVRMGERRWDMVLDRDQRLMLPQEHPLAALHRIVALHEAHDLLDRDVSTVDLRNAARPTVRLSQDATAAMRRQNINHISSGAGQ